VKDHICQSYRKNSSASVLSETRYYRLFRHQQAQSSECRKKLIACLWPLCEYKVFVVWERRVFQWRRIRRRKRRENGEGWSN